MEKQILVVLTKYHTVSELENVVGHDLVKMLDWLRLDMDDSLGLDDLSNILLFVGWSMGIHN